ncbi:hypothetical protein MTP09_12820 [Chryseobacterium suipulveris]|uniref:Uncharacterized protein n=1 Tax=Chryseobacterium suipulveris TaxID=2929800 RepID=A0ABY4BNM3_9FLAO|nr:hypothetical protein [Chryseobacterium suipulveris]UOE40773.1 hypothetical protein MTP09_12820 [Chryseobacterium suipulveris]
MKTINKILTLLLLTFTVFLTFIIYKQQKEINSIKKNINVKKDVWSNQSFDSSFNNDEINDKVLNLEREIEDLKSEVETLKLNLNNF